MPQEIARNLKVRRKRNLSWRMFFEGSLELPGCGKAAETLASVLGGEFFRAVGLRVDEAGGAELDASSKYKVGYEIVFVHGATFTEESAIEKDVVRNGSTFDAGEEESPEKALGGGSAVSLEELLCVGCR